MLSLFKNTLNHVAASDETLVGRRIDRDPAVESLVRDLVDEVSAHNNSIDTVRGPNESLKVQAQKKAEEIAKLRGRPLYHNYIGTGAGRGPFVELEDGSIKLDLINGIGIHLMGHSHPRVMQASVRGALSDIIMQGNLQPNNEYLHLTEKLVRIAGRRSNLKHAWFSTCGTMANENALKMARQKNSPARFVFAMKNAFAGRSTMMAEVTDNAAYKQGLPEYNEVLRIPNYDKRDPQSIEKALRAMKEQYAQHEKDVSCFVFEPMLGEGGFVPTPREFYIPMLEFCKQNKIAVWADEVQTFARTGEFFAFETMDLGQYMDIVTIAKTVQLGATLYTEEYNPKPGLIAGTFSGGTSSMAAGLEILNMLEEGYLGPNGRIQQIHQRFIDGLNKLNETTCKDLTRDAGGMGLMIAFTPFDGKKEQVEALVKKLFANGLIAFSCGKDPVRIRFLVPAIIQDSEIDLALQIVEKTILEGL
ncbi:aminotransferase class III-fold pyridoxal phosphate-dependent enzyme [Pseudobdellovibrio exovorus]|uniref:Acetylornithine/succinyldiaminopimelate aminotransferase n=1 Tax=Pseudobdellovibrio exovorus JSS TaxID=1184267 RepID=M4VB18_9BACT|nr:aminotransferase class III-fold pyridoxal phosphate-dependent enzyme [Pseudobdellovibrio exovorus]AGH96577.1 acetylornithine/succinyldiaminopimelate aminotransferase [Pseudobdellovibrio exovorus JSS]